MDITLSEENFVLNNVNVGRETSATFTFDFSGRILSGSEVDVKFEAIPGVVDSGPFLYL